MTGHLLPGGRPHEIGLPSAAELEILRRQKKKYPRQPDEMDIALEEREEKLLA